MLRTQVQSQWLNLRLLRRKPRCLGWIRVLPYVHSRFNATSPNSHTKFQLQNIFLIRYKCIRNFCTKIFSDDPPELAEAGFTDTASEFEEGFWAGSEDDLTHLRINLYPSNTDLYLRNLFEAGTVQEILDIITYIPPTHLNEKHSTQALVSLWDLQKLLFRIGPSFDPVKDFTNKKDFVEKLKNHPVFSEKIVQHVVSHSEVLEDEPLAASLLCLKRLNYCTRSPPCQILIEECIRRKHYFSLPALSRLAVCMKSESTYGALVMVDFLPFLQTRIAEMTDDLSFRLVSITLKSIHRLLSTSMIQSYRKRVRHILEKMKSDGPLLKLEVVTLCKILLCLLETKSGDVACLKTSPRVLIREVGNCIAERSDEMSVIEILSLHRFLDGGPQEPIKLIEAVVSRISTLIENDSDTPRLDLITCIVPFVKSFGQRQRLANYVDEYLDHYPQFEPVSHVLLKILKVVKLNNVELYDKYWSKATKVLSIDADDPHDITVRRVLRFAVDYIGFNQSLSFVYRNEDFESAVKKLLYFYLENYEQMKQPTMIFPADVTRALTFLIAFGAPTDQVFTKHDWLSLIDNNSQLRIADLHLIARGVEASLFYQREARRTHSKYLNKIMELCSNLEDGVSTKLHGDTTGESRLTSNDCVSISKIHLSIKRAFGDSPVFHEAVKRWTLQANTESIDSKLGREMATTLLCSNYNCPPVYDMLENFIFKNQTSVSPDLAEKFACLAFSIGYESELTANDESNVFRVCHAILEKHFTKLQPYGVLQFALALCFYRTLQTSLVHNIFAVRFLDEVDEELTGSIGYGSYSMRVRQAFMELNRAICIDMPDSNVPWFHKKFCEDVLSVSSTRESYINKEINIVLTEVLNDPAFVKRDVYSPYFYLLDFLIEFDTKGRPIKEIQKKRSIFSQPNNNPVEIGWKAAVLVLPNRAFTRNVRQLKGFYKLRRRHLEILGYHIVEIDPQHWNSMYMSEPLAKNDFLENKIFSRNREKASKMDVV